jgi:BirA family biotin operon repressor/biotin-[acetyl-CoA-carboxylase] ligase
MIPVTGRLGPVEIRDVLKTELMGRRIHCYGSVRSTNRAALEMARGGAPEGTLVLAEEQLAGRGRLGRTWHSPPGLGLWLSLILRPRVPADRVFQVAICGALAVAETVLARYPLDVRVKWPNDVLIGKGKLAGVLVETQWNGPDAGGVVAGMGINVNHRTGDFPGFLRHRATSLRIELDRPVDRAGLLADLLACFESIYLRFQDRGLEPFLERWRELSAVLGRPVSVHVGERSYHGLAAGIDPLGALLVDQERGGRRRFLAGDVSLSKTPAGGEPPCNRHPAGSLSFKERKTCG